MIADGRANRTPVSRAISQLDQNHRPTEIKGVISVVTGGPSSRPEGLHSGDSSIRGTEVPEEEVSPRVRITEPGEGQTGTGTNQNLEAGRVSTGGITG